MYAYFLPNGIRLDAERIVDAALEEGEYPQSYLDTETGVLVAVPSVDSLELWERHGGTSARYVPIERMGDEERDAALEAFVSEMLKEEVTLAMATRRALSRGGWRVAEDLLAGRADGWFDLWHDFLEDEAYAYVHEWLSGHPDLSIETVFEGCGQCAVCELVLRGEEGDRKKLDEAHRTEDVMRRVAEQMACYTREGGSGGEKGKRKSTGNGDG